MSVAACEVRPRKDHRGVDLIFDAAIDYSCTLYDSQRFVIECPARSTTLFSCYEKLDDLHFGPVFSSDDAGFVQ